MADVANSRDVFPFFKLPLEMREAIYDECLEHRERMLKYGGLKYQASNMPRLNLLLVAEQFKQECSARTGGRETVLLRDIVCGKIKASRFNLPNALSKCDRINADISLHPKTPEDDADMHGDWLAKLEKAGDGIRLQVNIKTTQPVRNTAIHVLCVNNLAKADETTATINIDVYEAKMQSPFQYQSVD